MPRGNDARAADAELFSQYGVHGNAAGLVRAHAASQDPAVKRAGRIPVDEGATEEYKAQKGWQKKAAEKLGLPEGCEVEDVAVRGNALSVVYTDQFGDVRKGVGAANENYVAPKLTAVEQARFEAGKVEAQVAQETARLAAELRERIDTQAADLRAEFEETMAQVKADHAERMRAVDEANAANAAAPLASEAEVAEAQAAADAAAAQAEAEAQADAEAAEDAKAAEAEKTTAKATAAKQTSGKSKG